ncbi:hypothetical protein ACS0TY_036024 [Phlomoides rotata]
MGINIGIENIKIDGRTVGMTKLPLVFNLLMIEMENLLKEMKDKPIDEKLCTEISAKFNTSTYRSEKSPIQWAQVQNWFRDKQIVVGANVASPPKGAVISKAAVAKKREKVQTISASEAAVELSGLMFEARSAKDFAWFDVGSFLSYKFLCSGELVVRVRFAGFGKEEDEWVSVKRAVRERSLPLEPSECDKINVGDLVLCFRDNLDYALYGDAHVVEIERKLHDSDACTCIFTVCYEHDNTEGKVTLAKLCCRPTKSASDNLVPLDPIGMQKGMVKDEILVE